MKKLLFTTIALFTMAVLASAQTNSNECAQLIASNKQLAIDIKMYTDTWDKIFVTMLHECCHVYLYYNGYKDFDQHEDRFKKLAKRVCDVYIGIDIREF